MPSSGKPCARCLLSLGSAESKPLFAAALPEPCEVETSLVRAAGAAAVPGRRLTRLVVDLERVPAPAGRDDVRVVDGEPALEAVDEIDLRAPQVRRAVRVDDDIDAVHGGLDVAL